MQAWWAGLNKARQMMLAALVVMFVSQFLEYTGSRTVQTGMPIVGSGGGDYVPNVVATINEHVAGANGWSMHPLAIVFLGALAVLFGLNPTLPPAVQPWRYRLGFLGLLFCFLPINLGDGPGLGFFLGIAALVIGGVAWRMGGRPAPAPVA